MQQIFFIPVYPVFGYFIVFYFPVSVAVLDSNIKETYVVKLMFIDDVFYWVAKISEWIMGN